MPRKALFGAEAPEVSGQSRDLLRELRSLPGVKKVFVRSGPRFWPLCAPLGCWLEELSSITFPGQLRLAPEHVSDEVSGDGEAE